MLIIVFVVVIVTMLLLDLGVFNKKSHEVSNKEAITNYFDMVYTTNSKFSKYWDKTDRCFSIRDHLKIINLF